MLPLSFVDLQFRTMSMPRDAAASFNSYIVCTAGRVYRVRIAGQQFAGSSSDKEGPTTVLDASVPETEAVQVRDPHFGESYPRPR